MDYKAILTNKGAEKISRAISTDTQVPFFNFAVGDGNGSEYTPIPTQTRLRREKWRGGISKIEPSEADASVVKITATIPTNVGGFTIREYGVFDKSGDMVIVGNTPAIIKSSVVESYSNDFVIEVLIDVGAQEAVTLDAESVSVATMQEVKRLGLDVVDGALCAVWKEEV